MLESGAVLGKSISEEAAAKLKSIDGANKTAKLAKQLIQLSGPGAGLVDVRIQACDAVISRRAMAGLDGLSWPSSFR